MKKYTFGNSFYDGTYVSELVSPIHLIVKSDDSIHNDGVIDKIMDHVVDRVIMNYITSDDLRIINLNLHYTNNSYSLLVTGDLVRVEKFIKYGI